MKTWEQLTIYIGETDHWHGQPLYMALVEAARQHGIIGATVTRGIAGFGKRQHGEIHTTRIFELSSDLPMVVTIIDNTEVIAAFLSVVQEMVTEGIVTQDTVRVVHHAP
jgi:PII-like signaling protein